MFASSSGSFAKALKKISLKKQIEELKNKSKQSFTNKIKIYNLEQRLKEMDKPIMNNINQNNQNVKIKHNNTNNKLENKNPINKNILKKNNIIQPLKKTKNIKNSILKNKNNIPKKINKYKNKKTKSTNSFKRNKNNIPKIINKRQAKVKTLKNKNKSNTKYHKNKLNDTIDKLLGTDSDDDCYIDRYRTMRSKFIKSGNNSQYIYVLENILYAK